VFVAVPDTRSLAVPNTTADLPRSRAPAGSALDHSYRRLRARFDYRLTRRCVRLCGERGKLRTGIMRARG